MKLLFVVITDLSGNNSAALCHNSYIRGMMECGHSIDVITIDNTALEIDGIIPGVHYTYYSDENFIIRKIRAKRNGINPIATNPTEGNKAAGGSIISRAKGVALSVGRCLFGASILLKHRTSHYFCHEDFDAVISLSSPPLSHEIAARLIKKKRIQTKNYCQIWEDPWAADLYGQYSRKIARQEEKDLNKAEKVIYVSPITLENQKRMFPRNAYKMEWLPLPSYYKDTEKYVPDVQRTVYGYFGQYEPHVRNLRPFYEALLCSGNQAIICGEPSNLFQQTKNISVFPRLSITDLAVQEKKTDILVCVANLHGGQIPGKIYQYSATQKPILFILDGTEKEKNILRTYFSQFERYYFCENDCKSIVSAMEEIQLDKHPFERITYFEPSNIASEIIRLIGV